MCPVLQARQADRMAPQADGAQTLESSLSTALLAIAIVAVGFTFIRVVRLH